MRREREGKRRRVERKMEGGKEKGRWREERREGDGGREEHDFLCYRVALFLPVTLVHVQYVYLCVCARVRVSVPVCISISVCVCACTYECVPVCLTGSLLIVCQKK